MLPSRQVYRVYHVSWDYMCTSLSLLDSQLLAYRCRSKWFITFVSVLPASKTRNSSDKIPERDRVQKCGVGVLYPWNHERGRILSDVVGTVYINLHFEYELPCSNNFRDKQGVL